MAHHSMALSQLLHLVPRHEFNALAIEHLRGAKLRSIHRWSRFVALALGQLTSPVGKLSVHRMPPRGQPLERSQLGRRRTG
ncbi:DUF4372 domain-containing protein [Ectothiorhodospiraceae bacterium WFHF3C12]|nr:DUF4372 domain-containing protein [Ectothiorhodospiraceae bacterium WFHF3C12]